MALLDPDLVVHADVAALPARAQREVHSAETWARQAITAARGAKMARVALVNGAPGLVIAPRGRLFRAIRFTIVDGKIAGIDVVDSAERLRALDR